MDKEVEEEYIVQLDNTVTDILLLYCCVLVYVSHSTNNIAQCSRVS